MTVAGAETPRKTRPKVGGKPRSPRHAPGRAISPAPAAADLLSWYDRHRRDLPWRAPAGLVADPYRVWLSEIMLQQTTVTAVVPYFARFLARWPSIVALAAAPLEDVLRAWAGLGYYARARNLHACARKVVDKYRGAFPTNEIELRELPGVGAYTAGAIAAIAFGARAAAVDGNVERVIARLYAIEQELPAAKPQIRRHAEALVPPWRSGDFAQAMMDLGATICTPARPACAICPWMAVCLARKRGDPTVFPRRQRKAEGRLRRGAAFVLTNARGELLVRTRPPKGLLGGMTEVLTTQWSHDFDVDQATSEAPRLSHARPQWQRLPGAVRHVFTHFPLELVVYRAQVAAATRAPAGTRWIALASLGEEALPSLMRKVVAHAVGNQL
jgi:A/G-specific adenine glycosylase